MVTPGRTSPASGPMMWTIPCRGSVMSYRDTPAPRAFWRSASIWSRLSRSSIRNARRPLGPVFHSLAVALELAAFRDAVDERYEPRLHPNTDLLLASAQDTIRSIVWEPDWQHQLKTRGRFLFEAYRDLWERLAKRRPNVVAALVGESC